MWKQQIENLQSVVERQSQHTLNSIKEKQALEAIFEKTRSENGKTVKLINEKDGEIEFLQREISQLMKEKAEKEQIIKTLT